MPTGNYILKKWHLLAILFAGTLIRFIYGYTSKAWLGAPDQLAWGLSIDEMLHSKNWSYIQLIHAPNEGGGLLISLVSLLFRPFQFILPSLSFAALTLDTIARLVQIKTTQKIFGNQTAFWFGVWTILSVPLIIPWGTVNFGLHSLTSFIPFVFFYYAVTYKENKYLPAICGLISGIAISVSYDSVILIPVSVLFVLSVSSGFKTGFVKVLTLLAVCSLAVLPHLFARVYFYTGFSLETNPVLSVRGVPLNNVFTGSHFTNLFMAWCKPLPGSFLLSSIHFFGETVLTLIVFLFLAAGFLFYIFKATIKTNIKLLSSGIIFLFVAAYAFSPFYEESYRSKSYVYYRHLSYIIPFVTVIMINGFLHSGKLKWYLVSTWLILCGFASFQYMYAFRPIDKPTYRAAGWILARKYGDNVNKLFQIHAIAEIQCQDELLTGFGWGLSTALLKNKTDTGSVNKLIQKLDQCPAVYQPGIIKGIYYSFTKGITPVLDQKLAAVLDSYLSKRNKTNL